MVPAAASAPSTWVWAQAAMFGSSASTTAGACRAGDAWNACAPITRPMYSRIGRIATSGMTASSSAARPRKHTSAMHDAGRQRVADPAADRLPAGMADVHRRRERAAEERADDGADAVGQQDRGAGCSCRRRPRRSRRCSSPR